MNQQTGYVRCVNARLRMRTSHLYHPGKQGRSGDPLKRPTQTRNNQCLQPHLDHHREVYVVFAAQWLTALKVTLMHTTLAQMEKAAHALRERAVDNQRETTNGRLLGLKSHKVLA
jgi:hypothetical protein